MQAVGCEDLLAGDAKALPIGNGGGGELRHRRARVGLGHGHSDETVSAEQRIQIAVLLLRGSELREGADRAEISRLDDVGGPWTGGGDLLDRNHSVHQRSAYPAFLLGHGDAEQALLRHHPGDVPWIIVTMRPGERA